MCAVKIPASGKRGSKDAALELKFLGTRGEIEVRSRRHQRHSALLVEHNNARIMIDCGVDWLDRLDVVAPTAIVLTHAHLDHAGGLAEGAPCPVYATGKTLAKAFPYSRSPHHTADAYTENLWSKL